MPRGGTRKGAGRKSEWPSGCRFENTTTIRIPKELKEKVVEFAKKLDAEEVLDLDTESKNSEQIGLFVDVLNHWIEKIGSKSGDKEWLKVTELVVELAKIVGIDFLPQASSSSTKIELVTDSEIAPKQLVLLFEDASLDSVTKSISTDKMPTSLNAVELAKRLNVSVPTVSRYKKGIRNTSLEDWSRLRDPQKLSWRYDRKRGRFYPIL